MILKLPVTKKLMASKMLWGYTNLGYAKTNNIKLLTMTLTPALRFLVKLPV
jgi:hypothetical protein